MPEDIGVLNINAAGTAETFASDLSSTSVIRAASVVTSILFKAPVTNAGNVYIGLLDRAGNTSVQNDGTLGFTLQPGESLSKDNISEKFGHWEGDAATTSDKIEWSATFQAGATA